MSSSTNIEITYGAGGGYYSTSPPGSVASLSFINGFGSSVPYISYFDGDSLAPQSVVTTLDPSYIHYSHIETAGCRPAMKPVS